MHLLNLKKYWQKADFYGIASLLFRYAAYLSTAAYLLLFLKYYDIPLGPSHYIFFVISVFLPYFLFIYYVAHNNHKGIGIRQNMVDFVIMGWFIGLIHLLYLPSSILILGLICNYVASKGFYKFYRVLMIPVGYLLSLPVYGFQLKTDLSDMMLHLTLLYALIHFVSIAYISYRFSQNLQETNKKVTHQQKEILTQSEELQALNESLRSLNNHLEEKVMERTQQLELKNEKLAEYTFINGHQLRAPVATLLGLCNLLNYAEDIQEKNNLIEKLRWQVNILDATIKEIRFKLEAEKIIVDKVKKVETEHSQFEKFKSKLN